MFFACNSFSQIADCDSIFKNFKFETKDTIQLKSYTTKIQNIIQENCKLAICLSRAAIDRSEQLGSIDLRLQFYALLGYAYKAKGDFELSIRTFIAGLKLAEKNGFATRAAFMANNLGTAFLEAKKYKAAELYFLIAIKNGKLRNDRLQLARTYANYGYLKEEQKQHDSALYYYSIAKPEFVKVKDSIRLADLLLNIGRSELSLEKFTSCFTNFNEALTIYQRFDDLDGACRTRLNIAEAYTANKQINLALRENEKALNLARKLQSDYLLDFCYAALSESHAISGNYHKAFEFYKLHKQINDSLNSEEVNLKITKIQEQYQGEKKDTEIKAQAITIKLQENEKRNLFLILFFAILVTLIILVFVILLRGKNGKLEKLVNEKQFLIHEVHHRVKNNLQLLSSIIELQMRSLDNKELYSLLQENQNRIIAIANLHDKLFKQDNVQNVDLDVYIKALAEDICRSYSGGKLKVNLELEPIKIHVDKTILIGLLVNEIITNAIKHAFSNQPEPKINILLKAGNQKLKLVISDNGKGSNFNLDSLSNKSLGFKLIKSLSKQLGANIQFDSSSGLTYKFEFEK